MSKRTELNFWVGLLAPIATIFAVVFFVWGGTDAQEVLIRDAKMSDLYAVVAVHAILINLWAKVL